MTEENDHDDLEHTVSNVMPQIFFTTSFSVADMKKQYRMRNSVENEGQVLDSAIHHFFSLPQEKQFYSLYKRRYLIAPSQTTNNNALDS